MKKISIDNSILRKSLAKSLIKISPKLNDSEIVLQSNSGFSKDNFILIRSVGNDNAEIVGIDNVKNDGETIELTSNIKNLHPTSAPVKMIPWNRIVISWSEEIDGGKTIIDDIPFQVDEEETVYEVQDKVDGYFFLKYENNITGKTSDYSDPIPYSGYDSNTVSRIIRYALGRNGLDSFTDRISNDFCIEEINMCLKDIRGFKKKWSHFQEFEHSLGYISRGENELEVPIDMWDKSNRSVLDIRLSSGKSLTYRDKREWNELMIGVKNKKIVDIGLDYIELESANDYLDSGYLMIDGNVIEYTEKEGNKLLTEETEKAAVGSRAWQGSFVEAQPRFYTIYGGKILLWPLTSPQRPKREVIIDYWTEAPEVQSGSDVLDIHRFDMCKYWLTWAIRMERLNDGQRVFEDGDYQKYQNSLIQARKTESHGQKYKRKPNLNTIKYNNLR